MRIAIVGATGLVGRELTQLLEEENPILFDSKSQITFDGIDVAFFCVENDLAKTLIPEARAKGVICIDSSSAFRKDPQVPLIIPEINGDLLNHHQGIIASPNCTTTLMLLPLARLHQQFQIKRIVAATYQAVSGAGKKGIEELERQVDGSLKTPGFFPHFCAFNVFPHESQGVEEEKMRSESHKILNDPSINVAARCARVPVYRVHSIALNVEFAKPFALEEAKELIEHSPGVEFRENFSALDAAHKHVILCGSLRIDKTKENTLELWVAGDQLLKGAALNMYQIYLRYKNEKNPPFDLSSNIAAGKGIH